MTWTNGPRIFQLNPDRTWPSGYGLQTLRATINFDHRHLPHVDLELALAEESTTLIITDPSTLQLLRRLLARVAAVMNSEKNLDLEDPKVYTIVMTPVASAEVSTDEADSPELYPDEGAER